MYFGSNQISHRLQIHSELQIRNLEMLGNTTQLLARTGLKFQLASKLAATLGYGYINNYPATEPKLPSLEQEHRIWQEFNAKQQFGRVHFEHRYRIEQRYLVPISDWRLRFRYRLYCAIALNNKELIPGTFFLSTYDEVFINRRLPQFSQNRLYFAGGYVASEHLSVQLGYLFQQFTGRVPEYLQIGLFFNPDLRRKKLDQ